MKFINTWHQGAARRVVHRFEARRKAVAMENPRYAEIQGRRGEDGLTLISDELTFADWSEQLEIESKVKEPGYVKIAAFLAEAELFGVFKRALRRWRRVRNLVAGGIDDEEWWGLNFALCARLAKQLDALADGAHSWPGAERGYASAQEWADTLRAKASELRRYAGSVEQEEALGQWHKLVVTQGVDEAALEAARVAHDKIKIGDGEAAKSALIWVAQNLDLLDD